MDAETIQLILDMGASGANVEEVTKRLEGLRGSVRTTADSYEVLERQVGEYEVLERRVAATTQAVVQAEAARADMLQSLGIQVHATNLATAETGRSLGKDGAFGRGIMSASFAVQDFTSVLGTQGLGQALGAVQNNIPILVTSLGAGAGLAGVISIVSIGVGLLIDNWDKLTGAWNKEDTKKEAERMEKLRKEIEATAEAADRLARTRPAQERGEQKSFRTAVDEFGGQAVLDELRKGLVARGGSFGPEADKQMAKNLFANLMQGNRSAFNLMSELDLRGDVGATLKGLADPAEERAAALARGQKDAAAAAAAREKKRRDDEKAEEERKKRKDEDAAAWRDHDERTRASLERTRDRERGQSGALRRAPGPGLHETMEAGGLQSVRNMQAEVMRQTGQRISPQEAIRMIQHVKQQQEQAQGQFLNAVLDAVSGRQREVQMLQHATRAVRQRAQPATNAGWN
jgi:hypothetical protein